MDNDPGSRGVARLKLSLPCLRDGRARARGRQVRAYAGPLCIRQGTPTRHRRFNEAGLLSVLRWRRTGGGTPIGKSDRQCRRAGRHGGRSDGAEPRPSRRRSQLGLDWLNFFQADVQTAFGPFVAVYLALRHWPQHEVGIVLAVGVVTAIVTQIPGGALVDAVAAKRLLIGAAVSLLAAGALTLAIWPQLWPVALAEALMGAASGVIRPSLAGLAKGLVGHRALGHRLGRNQLCNSLGTALTAGMMGVLGGFLSPAAPFYIAAILCLPAVLSLAMIRPRDIDYAEMRAADRAEPRRARRVRETARNRAIHVFIALMFLFQFANAALLPLAAGRLGYAHGTSSMLTTSAAVLVPQTMTALIAMWVARHVDQLGRKPLVLVGLAAVGVRAAILSVVQDPWMLVPIQAIDGLSAAIIGVIMPLVIADLTQGTGRYNLVQGYAGTATAAGGALSVALTGFEVEWLGYMPSFLTLAAIALVAIAVGWRYLPETRQDATMERRSHDTHGADLAGTH